MNSNQLVDTIEQHKPHWNSTTAICDITGIALAFDLPNIEGMYMDYINPLSIYKNVVSMSKLPYKVYWSKYRIDIVAGCFLSAATYHHLIQDKLSAAHRNILLQECPHFLLVEAIRFIISLTSRQLSHLDKMSFGEGIEYKRKDKPAFHTLTDWLAESKAAIYPISSDKGTATELQNARDYSIRLLDAKLGNKRINAIPFKISLKENKDNIKIFITEGIEESIFQPKLIPLLKLLTHSNNLSNMDEQLRVRYSNILGKIDHEIAREIIKIINHPVYSSSEKILIDRVQDIRSGSISIGNEISEESIYKSSIKLTISQIIEAKQKGISLADMQITIKKQQQQEIGGESV